MLFLLRILYYFYLFSKLLFLMLIMWRSEQRHCLFHLLTWVRTSVKNLKSMWFVIKIVYFSIWIDFYHSFIVFFSIKPTENYGKIFFCCKININLRATVGLLLRKKTLIEEVFSFIPYFAWVHSWSTDHLIVFLNYFVN